MAVFRDVNLEYQGKTYVLSPSLRFLRRIDGELSKSNTSLISVIGRVSSANPPIFDVAYIVCEFLREAGAKDVDEDTVYADLMDDMSNNNGEGFAALVLSIAAAITPEGKDVANPQVKAPQRKKKSPARK